jgi:hypothetical protein
MPDTPPLPTTVSTPAGIQGLTSTVIYVFEEDTFAPTDDPHKQRVSLK